MVLLRTFVVAMVGTLAVLPAIPSSAHASPGMDGFCRARVLQSEELPYAPPGYWLVRATLAIDAPDGSTLVTTLYKNLNWQRTIRPGDHVVLRCSSPDLGELRFIR